jgi:8-oxo-dGTP diphosphatase
MILLSEKMIQVCCAIIIIDRQMLAVQRGLESSHPMKWEFPGGKIQENETDEQAIVREIQEELSVQIGELTQLDSIVFDYGTKQIDLIPFLCKINSGQIILTEHIAMQWFSLDDWESIDWSGADRELILKNGERLKLMV